jgi:hypothetical protein
MSKDDLIKPTVAGFDFTFNPEILPQGASLDKQESSIAVVHLWHRFSASATPLPQVVAVYFEDQCAAEAFRDDWENKPENAHLLTMGQKEVYDKILAETVSSISKALTGDRLSGGLSTWLDLKPGTGKTH